MYKVIPFFFHFTFPSTNFRNRTYWIQPPESNAQHIHLQSWTMGASENIHVNWPYWSFWKCSGCWCCEYSSSFLVQFKCFVVNCYVQGSIRPFFPPTFSFHPSTDSHNLLEFLKSRRTFFRLKKNSAKHNRLSQAVYKYHHQKWEHLCCFQVHLCRSNLYINFMFFHG